MKKSGFLLVFLSLCLGACGTKQVVPQQTVPQESIEDLMMCPATTERYTPYRSGHSAHTLHLDGIIEQIQLSVNSENTGRAKVFLEKYYAFAVKFAKTKKDPIGLNKINIVMANLQIKIGDHTDLDPRCGGEQKLLPAM